MTGPRPTRREALGIVAAPVLALPAILRGGGRAVAGAVPAHFRRGVNTWPWFSLTREYPAPRTDYAWPPFQENRAVPRAVDLKRLAAAGFDFIRMPVDPGPFLDANADRRLQLLRSLIDAVALAQSKGLGVVVNLQPNEATHYWRSQTLIASTDAPKFEAYRALVALVARKLAGLPFERLALEPVNEPPQQCASGDWNDVQRALLTAARSAAPRLTLVATGACGSMVSGIAALDPAPLAPLAPLLFTFHFYEPYLFSHQGAPWMREPVYRALNDVPWPASAGSLDETLAAVRARMAVDRGLSEDAKRDAYAITERLMKQYFDADPDRRFLDRYLDHVSTWADAHGIGPDRILMGEFGAVKTTASIAASHPADRVRYVSDVRLAAEKRGFAWAFWNLFDSMGLMNDTTRALDPDILRALGLAMPPE